MSIVDMTLLLVSMAIVVGISSLLPWAAWQDYKYEKARNESLKVKGQASKSTSVK